MNKNDYLQTLITLYKETGDETYLQRINAVCDSVESWDFGIIGDWQKKTGESGEAR